MKKFPILILFYFLLSSNFKKIILFVSFYVISFLFIIFLLGNEFGEYTLQVIRNRGEKAQCVCCRNPRRNKGSKKDQLTIQEKRNEWHDEEIEAQAPAC